MVDTIAGDASTTATISIGGTVTSAVDTIGDHDWFQITLTAGQAITVTLNGVTLSDPYLRIRDAGGNVVAENDDFGSLNSQISFQATQGGTYYIDVAAWADPQNPNASYPGVTGDYQLAVTAYQTPPLWTNDQIAQQLVTGYWGDGMHRFVLDQTRTITVNITGLDLNGQNLAVTALQQWSSITGINFVQTGGAAQITFTDNDPDGGAFTESTYSGANLSTSHVNIDTSWLTQYGTNVGGYTYQAYLHEIGHAIGLGHAGNYNGTAKYPYDALYQNDAWSTSVMSYFSQTENTYFAGQGFSRVYLVTPMVADILAMQQLYGLSTTTRNGNTTYGFNSNAGNPYNAAVLTNVAYTIFDTGGTDTMDYSGYSAAQLINLNPETFSNIGGRVGNVSIARGTIIENAVGGSGVDVIIGNSAANILTGGSGADTLTGGASDDTFRDTTAGLNGDTITDFGAGDRIVFTDATLAGFTFNLTGNTLTYSGGSLTLSAPVSGTIVASAASGGGVQLIVQDARNDFNGDGRSDILWRNDSGAFSNWLATANGGWQNNDANAASFAPTNWQIAGIGDFNGDHRDDILWRSDTGALSNWLATASGGWQNNDVNAASVAPTSWQIVGVGDFNGDNRDDILWRNTSGALSNWLSTANGGWQNNDANAASSAPTSWQIAAVGDFNGDNRDDILWRNDSGAFSNWLATANGGWQNNDVNAASFAPTSWHIVGVGDFNGDGRDDILWRSDTGALSNWLATANGGWQNNDINAASSAPLSWHIASIGDFNGDGRDDILWRSDTGALSNWLATATGGWQNNDVNAASAAPTTWHITSPDTLWV